ncbi:MAG: SpoIIE family protein phosphatase [Treponema sp.]|jgi:sigma-B regulation protein RsbU (phosphoserine phosphatase)|nr:SpoIIE family protein phosphatase [Treponema sp.]
MLNLTKYSQDANIQLGITASERSRDALLAQAEDYLGNIVTEQAAGTNSVLERIYSEVTGMAIFVETLYANPSAFSGKPVPLPPDTQEGIPSAKHSLAPGTARTAALNEELRRISSAEYMFSILLKNNPVLDTTYLGTESGISYRYSPSSDYNPGYDPRKRDWYITAMAGPDKAVWLDTYLDSYGDICITCARTYRDSNGRIAGVVAVDIFLESIIEDILDLRVGIGGYAFLLDRKGDYIAHPRYGEESFNTGPLTGRDGSLQQAIRAMIGGDHRAYEVEDEGEERYLLSAPLNETGWILCFSIPVQEVIAPANETKAEIDVFTDDAQQYIRKTLADILLQFIIIFAVSAILVVGFSFALSLTIIRPIQELALSVKQIGSGNFESKIAVKGKDEIAELGNAFNKMILDLNEYIKNLEIMTAEKERINSELSVAANIQSDMLPRIFPKFNNNSWLALFAQMEPAKHVGGDFYDFFYLNPEETELCFVIADVSGKGVPAALFMVIAKTLLRTHMLQSHDPALALKQVNTLLCEDNTLSMFVTAFICSLDLKTGILKYANGGHNRPLIAKAKGLYQFMELKKGRPLGLLENSVYLPCELRIQPGDKLYLYTDGVNEAMNAEGRQLGNDVFLSAANEFYDLPPRQFDEAIRRTIGAFVNGAEQSDDITTLAISFRALYENKHI